MSALPLEGRTIVVTRARAQAAELVDALAELGAEVLEFPTIRTVDPEEWTEVDAAARALDGYDWVVFTSANAVRAFLGRLETLGVGAADLVSGRVVAVGPGTASHLQARGITPGAVPRDHRGEGVVEALRERGAGPGVRVLIPRALEAREVLPETLREMGAAVDVVTVYRTVLGEGDPDVLARLREGGVDAVTFTSSSTVRNFVELTRDRSGGGPLEGVLTASIGPVTSDTLRSLGLGVGVEASPSTVPALASALAGHFSPGA